jgi:phosphopantetheinyl transferase (holo-ACP synthase)
MKTAVDFLESVEVDKFAKDCIKHRYNSYGENITSETQKLDTIYGFKQGFQKAIELLKQKTMKEKDLDYFKQNAEEDYMTTPISVLRYITELEQKIEELTKQQEQ